MKSFEDLLANIQGGALPSMLLETATEAKNEGKDLTEADKDDIEQPRQQ